MAKGIANIINVALIFLQIQLALSHKVGFVPSTESCNFIVDHGPASSYHTGDIDIELYKDGMRKTCYNIGDEYTFKVKVTNQDYHIKGFLVGVPKNSIDRENYTLPDNTINPGNLCRDSYIRFSHFDSKINFLSEINFQLIPLLDQIKFRTAIVFEYSKYISDKHITLSACPATPTPTATVPSQSPTPSQSQSPTPSPSSCASCSQLTDLRCPQKVEKVNDTRIETINGTEYKCILNGTLRNFTFPSICTLYKSCGPSCSLEEFTVNCSLIKRTRSRKYNCTPVDPANGTKTILRKLKVEIQREVKCSSTLSTS